MHLRSLAIVFTLGTVCLLASPAVGQDADSEIWTELPPDLAPLLEEGLNDAETEQIADRFLANRAAFFATQHDFPEGLTAFFNANPEQRNVFISAVDEHRDEIAKAAQILETLRGLGEARLKEYFHLATALAVVHDTPRTMFREIDRLIYGVSNDQLPDPVGPEELYEYYSNSPRGVRFLYQPTDLPWAMLVYVVDNQVSASDRVWACGRFRNMAVSALYDRVRYDEGKRDRETPRLGERPYTLPNLLRYGGVCGDQTYFASRVAKSLCVPALGASGENRFGGLHAWVGYLTTTRRRATLVFSGRYLYDYYYTGRVLDPQTGIQVLERHVAMMFDGMSVSYPRYERSRALVLLARQVKDARPNQSLALVKRALSVNPFLPGGWRLLMDHFEEGRVEPDEALTWFNRMLDALQPHPDMTYECLGAFIDCYAGDDLSQRSQMYRRALAIYDERPDLQMALCTRLADEMVDAGKKREALTFLLRPILSNANEGSVILPAVGTVIELAIDLGVAEQAKTELTKALRLFPRKRRGSREVSPAYEAFESMLDRLDD